MFSHHESKSSRVLVTGANGFVARHVVSRLMSDDHRVRLTTRTSASLRAAREKFSGIDDVIAVGELADADWTKAVKDVDCVIHLAARVHMMHETSSNPLVEYRRSNVDATVNLAKVAIQAGVRRFIYISSIKVNGEFTIPGQVFSQRDLPNPSDPYAQSKWQAELRLRELCKTASMELVIVRPPLIFGPGVGANFLRLINWVKRGIPLPLGLIANERSLLYVENFADALVKMINAPAVVGNTYTIADQPALSTANLIREIAKASGKSPRLLPVPIFVLKFLGKLTRQSSAIDRLTQSLLVDPHQLYRDLDWQPPISMADAISRTL